MLVLIEDFEMTLLFGFALFLDQFDGSIQCDGQQELQKKSSELMQPIVAKVRTAIEAVGKAGNYTFIFEDGAAVYTGTNVVDVTKEVQAKIK